MKYYNLALGRPDTETAVQQQSTTRALSRFCSIFVAKANLIRPDKDPNIRLKALAKHT